ncbi:MAG TPA: hypothetical protein VN112_14660 [Ensifer sp.]|nr:hypothetical protein [Ensifer sp.]
MWLNPQLIALLIAVVVAIIILAIGLTVVRLIWSKTMDLSMLLTEVTTDGTGQQQAKASLSRFQFLVFTFVVAGLYFVLSLESGYLIEVPNGTLVLLGISGVSYLGSKTISSGANPPPAQTSRQTTTSEPAAGTRTDNGGGNSNEPAGTGNGGQGGGSAKPANVGGSRNKVGSGNTGKGGKDGNQT